MDNNYLHQRQRLHHHHQSSSNTTVTPTKQLWSPRILLYHLQEGLLTVLQRQLGSDVMRSIPNCVKSVIEICIMSTDSIIVQSHLVINFPFNYQEIMYQKQSKKVCRVLSKGQIFFSWAVIYYYPMHYVLEVSLDQIKVLETKMVSFVTHELILHANK